MPLPKLSDDFGGVNWVFPFPGMQIGDSFFIPTLRPAGTIYTVETEAKEAKIRIQSRTVYQDGYLGVRFWRVA